MSAGTALMTSPLSTPRTEAALFNLFVAFMPCAENFTSKLCSFTALGYDQRINIVSNNSYIIDQIVARVQ